MSAQEYALRRDMPRTRMLLSNKKKEGPAARAVQISDAKKRLLRHCREQGLGLIYTCSQRGGTADLDKFDAVLHRFTARLADAGIHPWAVVREWNQRGALHAHLAVTQFVDLRLLCHLWRSSGESCLYIKPPDKARAHTYMPGKVGHYLTKDFDKLPARPGRQRYFFASKLRASERFDRTPLVARIAASSMGAAIEEGLRRARARSDGGLSHFYGGKHSATYEIQDGHVHGGQQSNALVRAIKEVLQWKRWEKSRR